MYFEKNGGFYSKEKLYRTTVCILSVQDSSSILTQGVRHYNQARKKLYNLRKEDACKLSFHIISWSHLKYLVLN